MAFINNDRNCQLICTWMSRRGEKDGWKTKGALLAAPWCLSYLKHKYTTHWATGLHLAFFSFVICLLWGLLSTDMDNRQKRGSKGTATSRVFLCQVLSLQPSTFFVMILFSISFSQPRVKPLLGRRRQGPLFAVCLHGVWIPREDALLMWADSMGNSAERAQKDTQPSVLLTPRISRTLTGGCLQVS